MTTYPLSSSSIPNAIVFGTQPSSTSTNMIYLNNIPSILNTSTAYEYLLQLYSSTNEYVINLSSIIIYYKFTTLFSLPNPNLSNNGQLSIFMYLYAYNNNTSTSTVFTDSVIYDVLVTLECDGSIQTSSIYNPSVVNPGSGVALPIYLTNLFPQMLQNVNTIYKVTVEAWSQ